MEKYVIIGNGVASAACIEGIRSVDPEGSITVISEEKHPVYCRPLISYYLEDKTDLQKMNYRKESFYKDNSCEVIYGKRASAIDKEAMEVTLEDGTKLPYTKVCVATGSSPFVPPFAGLDTVPEKFSFMTMDDAIALKKAVKKKSRVLIVGAGLIGLKCAEGLYGSVAEITVCDLADRILSSILDEESAAFVQKHLEKNGIKFMLADSAASFDGCSATMKSGKKVDFDILVLAVGVRANTSLVKDLGGEVNRGIVVNEKMQTSIENIYTAGDCAEGEDITFGDRRVLAILPNAYCQGYCAGVNMAGKDMIFDKAMPMNSIGLLGLHMMTAGTRYDSSQGGDIYEEKDETGMKKLFMKGNALTGFILVDRTERVGIYTSMIREKTPLDSVNFEMLKKSPSSAAFSKEVRRKMFGGVV